MTARVRLYASLVAAIAAPAVLHLAGHATLVVDVAAGIVLAESIIGWVEAGPAEPTPQQPTERVTPE